MKEHRTQGGADEVKRRRTLRAVRIGELARLKWRNVVFDAYGVRLNITDKKTKKLKYSRLFMAKEYLLQWKNNSHFSTEDSAEVFVSMTG